MRAVREVGRSAAIFRPSLAGDPLDAAAGPRGAMSVAYVAAAAPRAVARAPATAPQRHSAAAAPAPQRGGVALAVAAVGLVAARGRRGRRRGPAAVARSAASAVAEALCDGVAGAGGERREKSTFGRFALRLNGGRCVAVLAHQACHVVRPSSWPNLSNDGRGARVRERVLRMRPTCRHSVLRSP